MTMMKSSVALLFLVATVALFEEEVCSFAPSHNRLVHIHPQAGKQAGQQRAVAFTPWSLATATAAAAPKVILFMTSEGGEETNEETNDSDESTDRSPVEDDKEEAAAPEEKEPKASKKTSKKKTDLIGDVGDSVVEPDLAEAAETVFQVLVFVLTAIFEAVGPLLDKLGEGKLLEGIGGSLSETVSSFFASKNKVDVSIPYDAAAQLAYEQWLEKYPKDDTQEEDEGSFEIFVENYRLVTVRNIKAKRTETEQNARMAAWAEEMETWTENLQDNGEGASDVSPAPKAPPAVEIKFYDLNAQADTLSPEDYARILDQGLVESLVGGAVDFASNLWDKTGGWVDTFGKTGTFGVKKPKEAASKKAPAQKAAPNTFGTFGVKKPKAAAATAKKAPAKKAAPKVARKPVPKTKPVFKKPTEPVLSKWKQNPDGSITGRISGSANFRNGQTITTSPISKRNLSKGMTVVTGSGSRYYLN